MKKILSFIVLVLFILFFACNGSKKEKFIEYENYVKRYKKMQAIEDEYLLKSRIGPAVELSIGITLSLEYSELECSSKTNRNLYAFLKEKCYKYHDGDNRYRKAHSYDKAAFYIMAKHLNLRDKLKNSTSDILNSVYLELKKEDEEVR